MGCQNWGVDEDRISAAIERNTRALDEFRAALRQMNLRQERVLGEVVAVLADMRAEIRAHTARLEAHTEAIWRMLDRWGEGPTPAS